MEKPRYNFRHSESRTTVDNYAKETQYSCYLQVTSYKQLYISTIYQSNPYIYIYTHICVCVSVCVYIILGWPKCLSIQLLCGMNLLANPIYMYSLENISLPRY